MTIVNSVMLLLHEANFQKTHAKTTEFGLRSVRKESWPYEFVKEILTVLHDGYKTRAPIQEEPMVGNQQDIDQIPGLRRSILAFLEPRYQDHQFHQRYGIFTSPRDSARHPSACCGFGHDRSASPGWGSD